MAVGAYAILAFALGVTAGLLLRNTLAAMVLTLVVYSALFIVVGNAVRPLYAEPTTIQRPLVARDSTPVPPESWPVDYGYLDAAGREVDDPVTGRATGNKASSCA